MKKQVLTSAIIIFLVVVGAHFALRDKTEYKAPTPEQNMVATDKNSDLLVDPALSEQKVYNEPTPYTTFDVVYPQFKNASVEFNKKIEELVRGLAQSHAKDSEENWRARFDTQLPGENISQFPDSEERFQFYTSWTPAQVNKNAISILLRLGGYAGGAHGYENITSFNFDVVAQKEITLSELFAPDKNYLKTISDFTRTELAKQFRKTMEVKTKEDEQNFKDTIEPMLLSGTTPDEQNFSVFTFTDEAITFYFSQYQVAPYVLGESRVVMLRK